MKIVPIALCASTLGAGAAGGVVAQESPGWSFDGPAFVALSVTDLDARAEWYGRTLGLEVVREFEAPNGSVRGRLLRVGDVVVELLESNDPIGRDPAYPEARDFRFLGLFKSGVFVKGIEAFHGSLVSSGVTTDDRIGTDEVLGMRTFVFRDPDGNRLQAFERQGAQP